MYNYDANVVAGLSELKFCDFKKRYCW